MMRPARSPVHTVGPTAEIRILIEARQCLALPDGSCVGGTMEIRELAVIEASAGQGASAGLLLKATPPRLQRGLLSRQRLLLGTGRFREVPAVLVQAPGGYGKTSLLAQWRRECLGKGSIVLWLTAGPPDDPGRLLRSLVEAFRASACRPTFGQALLASPRTDPLEGLTEWLADIARSALDTVLVVDEAERLPPASLDALAYLVRNLPPNLRILIGMRGEMPAGLDDLVAYGQCVTVAASDLRFDVDETIELVRQRFGPDFDPGTAVRLHEMADGWSLGIQLVLAVMAAERDPWAAAERLLRQKGHLHHRLIGLLLANLDPADLALLTRVSVLDDFNPALASVVSGVPDAAERLRQIASSTPVLVAGEQSDWLRLHALARDALSERFGGLPAEERAELHLRAAQWLSAKGLVAAAARHAMAAGRRDWACELAERSLYDSLMARGRLDDVREWFGIIPRAESEARPRLLLAAAWSFAIGERHEEAERLVARVLARDDIDDQTRCECALIRAGAAVFADEPDRFAALHDPWAEDPPLNDPWLLKIHANRSAFRALLSGEPALARLRQQRAPRGDPEAGPGYLDGWSDFIAGLSYLWEGQVLLAERILRPALLQADADLGRRNPFSSMLAALLAAALWVRGQPREAELALANRLDVLERSGLPEAVLLAFRTLARIAEDRSEARALELLEGLEAVGELRALPRLRIVSLAEQVMLHARRYRAETCRGLTARIDALVAAEGPARGDLWRASTEVYCDMAHGYAAVAARDWKGAREPFERANAAARAAKRQRLHVETLGFRALVLHNCGENAAGLAQEAVELANVYGLTRVFEAAHPTLGERLVRIAARAPEASSPLAEPRRASPPAGAPPRQAEVDLVARSTALTPKEREVLELLARNLSNKEIGLTMNIHEDTVKWHVKNLFAKLSAGTRKQVVSRARLMGILTAAAA
jgi:LuxR family transcriptional regulator, maltose regulon positive regulatory protein